MNFIFCRKLKQKKKEHEEPHTKMVVIYKKKDTKMSLQKSQYTTHIASKLDIQNEIVCIE